jgi:RES domain-containing protein
MEVYRIALAKYAKGLVASGNPARWNSKDVKVIYAASSRSLACLENVVHRNALGLQELFRTMVIEVPDTLAMMVIKGENLKANWSLYESFPYTQAMGDAWVKESSSVLLQVPSAIIPQEFNYLINPAHVDFKKIKLLRTEAFRFDERLKK